MLRIEEAVKEGFESDSYPETLYYWRSSALTEKASFEKRYPPGENHTFTGSF